jgi:hypothetical protein
MSKQIYLSTLGLVWIIAAFGANVPDYFRIVLGVLGIGYIFYAYYTKKQY